MNKLIFLGVIPVAVLLGFFNINSLPTYELSALDYDGGNSHAKVMEGHIQIIVTDENGNVKQVVDKKNLIVKEGLQTAWDLVFEDINLNANATDSKFDTIRIGDGNTAPASTDTGLQTPIAGCNGLEDATVTGDSEAALVWAYVSVQFSGATCASSTVSEAVLVNSITGGEVLARQTFTDINFGAADTLTVNWNVTLADDGV